MIRDILIKSYLYIHFKIHIKYVNKILFVINKII